MKTIRLLLMVCVAAIPFNVYCIDKLTEHQNSKVELEIENRGTSILDSLKEMKLSDFSFYKKDSSTYVISFESYFDSICLNNVLKYNEMHFQETYGNDLIDMSMYGNLFQHGLKQIQSGSAFIGNFAIADTALINKAYRKTSVKKKLPVDMFFHWYNIDQNDSVALYLLKGNSIKKNLSTQNITHLSAQQVIRHVPTEYNKDWMPTKWGETLGYSITMHFDSLGTKALYDLTKRNVNQYIAFSINGKIVFIGIVNQVIDGGQIEISLKKPILREFYQKLLFKKNPNVIIKDLRYK